jgi:hypothetical protein
MLYPSCLISGMLKSGKVSAVAVEQQGNYLILHSQTVFANLQSVTCAMHRDMPGLPIAMHPMQSRVTSVKHVRMTSTQIVTNELTPYMPRIACGVTVAVS